MGFERPDEPAEFEELVREAKRAVAEAISTDQPLIFDESLWKRYKGHFAVAQYSKCAFCEMSIINHDCAVDHFAPKGEVWELSPNPKERGREHTAGLPNMRGRKAPRKASRGYWWLAYDWRNYLVVCSACNTKWKRCYFPVKETPRRWPPDPAVMEERLLLNPFDDAAPWRHFQFDTSGHIAAPGSVRGQATLETLGLDATPDGKSRRESLRLRRFTPAQEAYRYARKFNEYSQDGSQERAMFALENLWGLGSIEYEFTGMVRAIAEHVTGFTWDELMMLRSPADDSPAASR